MSLLTHSFEQKLLQSSLVELFQPIHRCFRRENRIPLIRISNPYWCPRIRERFLLYLSWVRLLFGVQRTLCSTARVWRSQHRDRRQTGKNLHPTQQLQPAAGAVTPSPKCSLRGKFSNSRSLSYLSLSVSESYNGDNGDKDGADGNDNGDPGPGTRSTGYPLFHSIFPTVVQSRYHDYPTWHRKKPKFRGVRWHAHCHTICSSERVCKQVRFQPGSWSFVFFFPLFFLIERERAQAR